MQKTLALVALALSITPAAAAPLRGAGCELVAGGFGSAGQTRVGMQKLVSGLEVPWGLAFLPGTQDYLVTERPGRIRLVRNMTQLERQPVATIAVGERGEGGLLGIALHPEFATNRLFYIYYTVEKNTGNVNRVERYRLAPDSRSARADRVIIDDIPAGTFHNGGRIKFGPDGMLYIGTGDARNPDNAQSPATTAGKLLRLTPDGQIPADNPWRGNAAFLVGIRNLQAFDWLTPDTLVVSDHGPSGELGRTAHDETTVASSGSNLGWPAIYGCEQRNAMVTPLLSWKQPASPPGGSVIYRGTAIPEWAGSYLIGTLGSQHLHRVVLRTDLRTRTVTVSGHEVYFHGSRPPQGFGRLRDLVTGPDGEVYVTTSNCDGRAQCPADGDAVYKIVPR